MLHHPYGKLFSSSFKELIYCSKSNFPTAFLLELLSNLLSIHRFLPYDLGCSHSYGEFVFDHSWADAYYSYGLKYYPKLQCCVPFTPVTGPRILVRNTTYKDNVFDIIVSAMKDLTDKVSDLS